MIENSSVNLSFEYSAAYKHSLTAIDLFRRRRGHMRRKGLFDVLSSWFWGGVCVCVCSCKSFFIVWKICAEFILCVERVIDRSGRIIFLLLYYCDSCKVPMFWAKKLYQYIFCDFKRIIIIIMKKCIKIYYRFVYYIIMID